MMIKVSILHHHHVRISSSRILRIEIDRFLATTQQDDPLSLFINRSLDKTTLENWFGQSIYENAYPRMPADRVLSASDLEQ